MASASDALRRAFALAPVGLRRPAVLLALAVPLVLSACVSSPPGMKTSALGATAASPVADAYGYTPVQISAFADGSRVALPSPRPEAARLAAGRKTVATIQSPANEAAALAADVAERKAATAAPAAASAAVAIKAARLAGAARPARPTAGRSVLSAALAPAAAVPATIAAVAETAGAVTVAAADGTAKAYEAVSDRLEDTFRGRDTITGDAAIDRLIERAAAENGIPSGLAYAVVRVESNYNPKAKGVGVYGLSQIQPATARGLGFAGRTGDLYDPEINLRYGMKYLAGAWEKSGGDICGAAMKYKGGHRTTRMSKSAAVYCANVKRHMAAIERRRGPANRQTLAAAAERQKQILASGHGAPARGVSPAAAAEARSVAAAATSPSGRAVAAAAVGVPGAAARVLPAVTTGEQSGARGGRIARNANPVAASSGPNVLGSD